MRNDFLAHGNWKNKKYIEKVKLASGKWRYFYSLAEYQSYMKGKNKTVSGVEKKEGTAALKDPKQEALNAISKGSSAIEGLKASNFTASGTDAKSKTESLQKSIAAGEKKISEALSKSSSESSKSSKKSGSSSGSSSKSSGKKSKGASSSKSSSKSKKEATEKAAKSSSSKTAKESKTSKSGTKAQTKTQSNGKITMGSLQKLFGVKANDVTTHADATKMISDMKSKYKNGSFGYLSAGDKTYRWSKSDGKIKIIDMDTNKEVSIDTYFKGLKDIKEFSTDKKSKK